MTVDFCKAVMRKDRLGMHRSGIDPDDPSLGTPLRGMAYMAMYAVHAKHTYAGMMVEEKDRPGI